jgi:hypothetical protein
MANLKISQLPQYTGSATGTWTILNNASQDATYKVLNSDLIPPVLNPAQGRLIYTDPTGKILTATSNIVATGTTLVVNATYSQTGSMSVSGSTKFTGTHNINGNTSVTGSANIIGSLQVSGDTSLTGSIRVSNNATMTGSVKITGSLNHEGRSSFTGSMQITGNVSVTGSISSSLSSNFNGVNISKGPIPNDPNNIYIGTNVFTSNIGSGNTNNGNIAIGVDTQPLNADSFDNVMIGNKILSGSYGQINEGNVLIGQGILTTNGYWAHDAVVIGGYAAENQSRFNNSVAIGGGAMRGNAYSSSLDIDNVAVGFSAMRSINTGGQNVVLGTYASDQTKVGYGNTSIGNGALTRMTSGSNNVAIGYGAGDRLNYPIYPLTGITSYALQSNNFFLSNREAPTTGPITYYNYNVSGSLMYGTFDQHPSGSSLRINGKLTVNTQSTFETTVNINSALRLAKSNPLPDGETNYGSLAVSGSHLYFNNGSTWYQVI